MACRAAAKEGEESASDDWRVQAGGVLEGRQIQRLVNLVAPAVAPPWEQGAAETQDPLPMMYAEAEGPGVPRVAERTGRASGQTA